ncbi:MAG: DNA polymerase III subunit chi [Parachlamydiales bacterium]|nr:DNA polymerase III subunit chi [Parachlamydiales bacterium]
MSQVKQAITIHFRRVLKNIDKLSAVCQIAQEQFLRKERLLITVPDETTEKYIDELLWRLPTDSFLPHFVRTSECEESIVITRWPKNLNHAGVLLNLCPNPTPIALQFLHIYELFDETHPSKKAISQKKWDIYSQAGYHVREN